MDDIFDLDEPFLSEQPSVTPKPKEPAFIHDLNPEQRQAVLTTEGPVLVLSGAGTGKTKVLTTRIAYLISQGFAWPRQILAVTFTNKAAREMKERLESMIGPASYGAWLGTFHAIGVKILRKFPEDVGLTRDFTVLNSDDQERVLKQIMTDAGIDVKRYAPATMLDIIQRWKDRGVMPEAVTAAQNTAYCEGRALSLYQAYQARLQSLNAVDFGDLLLLPLELFKKRPDVLQRYQQQFKYILVDEYQDTNVAQYLWLRLLAQEHRNICCVGDDDQSIYSWRGAEVENILSFKTIYPDALVVRLERNYRSTEHILGCASALIAHNEGRLGKTLKIGKHTDGPAEKVSIRGFWNGMQEAKGIVSDVEQEQLNGRSLSDIAILVRAGFQTRAFEEELIRAGIAYKIIGGFKFYEREEIRDAVAYLRLILNTNDDLSFLRIVNKPRRGIGDQALTAVSAAAKTFKLSLFDAVALAELKPAARKALDAFVQLMKQEREQAADLTPAQVARHILETSGYVDFWRQDKSIEAEGRLENLQELYNVLSDFNTLRDFIEYASLVTDADEQVTADQLVVMTLHASKGLEFGAVYLPGWEEGLFPHQKALDDGGHAALEEERRLAYVGMTRAREKVSISFAANRKVYGQWQNALPSRFIDELPPEHVIDLSDSSLGRHIRPDDVKGFVRTEHFWDSKPIQAFSPAVKSKRVGKRVYHDSFGYGTVIREEGERLEVHFDVSGTKKILAKFLEAV